MKYLKSATNKSYVVNGRIIPPAVTKENSWLAVSDDEYISICKLPAIASLIKANAIIVSERKPSSASSPSVDEDASKKINEANARAAEADKRAAEADKKAAEASKLFDQLKEEAETALSEKDAEIAKLREMLASLSKD